jgi:hypothetical protein
MADGADDMEIGARVDDLERMNPWMTHLHQPHEQGDKPHDEACRRAELMNDERDLKSLVLYVVRAHSLG